MLNKEKYKEESERIVELTRTVNQLKDTRDHLIGKVQQLENKIENMINKSDVKNILWNQNYDNFECLKKIMELVGIKHD